MMICSRRRLRKARADVTIPGFTAPRRLVEDRDRAGRFGERARAVITGRGFLWQENARRVIGMAQGGEEASERPG